MDVIPHSIFIGHCHITCLFLSTSACPSLLNDAIHRAACQRYVPRGFFCPATGGREVAACGTHGASESGREATRPEASETCLSCGQKRLGATCPSTKIPPPLAPVFNIVHGLQNTVGHECASHHRVKRVAWGRGLFFGLLQPGKQAQSREPLLHGGVGKRGSSDPRPPQMNFSLATS